MRLVVLTVVGQANGGPTHLIYVPLSTSDSCFVSCWPVGLLSVTCQMGVLPSHLTGINAKTASLTHLLLC